ncbi:c-type cytochrome [Pleionea litopenaei]|uniref:Cytochrome c n=1 Tax=Pleionea litopenaei TaxID=3070815 RepID=A0AA51RUL2_9GAMM|nr:cytochrome c [Pleionea sp. HL-JVS1]WMS87996.1 cytochrome c [Pleionea sp. HL-JVS1]
MNGLKGLVMVAIGLLGTTVNFASAADIEKGKQKALICGSCHGKDGVGIAENIPNLAGQKETYLALQLLAFRDGFRKNMQMTPMAKGLTDEDIQNIAAFYASLPAKK